MLTLTDVNEQGLQQEMQGFRHYPKLTEIAQNIHSKYPQSIPEMNPQIITVLL